MVHMTHPDLLRRLVDDRHAELRRAAGASRVRREYRDAVPHRRRRLRPGPAR